MGVRLQKDCYNKMYDKKRLEELLLMPIMCKARYKSIEIKNGIILTGQQFYSSPDEDMSDIAIAFYEIMYSKVLNGAKILIENKKRMITDITNCCFAGDTMNSFNTIANLLKDKKNELSNDDKKLLEDYQEKYHCLANFWILPTCLGRRGKKGNNFDSMDIFLNTLEEDYGGVFKKHQSYYRAWNNISSFRKAHFLEEYKQMKTAEIRELYLKKDAKTLIDISIKIMENRAKAISESNIGEKLWEYFETLVND